MTTNHKDTILVVEDSRVNQKLLERLLIEDGYNVVLAGDAELALSLLLEPGGIVPDLIVLDIILPGMDGFELCEYLKKEDRFQDIPVIFISALEEVDDKLRGFEVGGVDYVTKPFHSREVLVRISNHLKLCRLQRQLEENVSQLSLEKQKSEALLCNVLPVTVAEELMEKGSFTPQSYDDVSVCFIDIINFTSASAKLKPEVVIRELNELFSGFDDIVARFDCERIKTIGDAYFCTCGLPTPDPDNVEKMADAALTMLRFLHYRNTTAEHRWQVRIGMHVGSVVGGIVGIDKYLYDVFGDAVNIASRLEALSAPMKINVSSQVQQRLAGQFSFSESIQVDMKGKGRQSTFFLEKRL
ncbi:MAG: adenylate/guanylate cyclase [Desulfobulbus propionicus]|nr:MAG: adenylate/guanylate cyclase [Desulfobulbus propionicus]